MQEREKFGPHYPANGWISWMFASTTRRTDPSMTHIVQFRSSVLQHNDPICYVLTLTLCVLYNVTTGKIRHL